MIAMVVEGLVDRPYPRGVLQGATELSGVWLEGSLGLVSREGRYSSTCISSMLRRMWVGQGKAG